jgi:DCN1-like protein 1/2
VIKRRLGEASQPQHRETFKRVYRHTFKLFLQPPARSLDIDTAILLWTILLSPQGVKWETESSSSGTVTWFDLWSEFLRTKSKRPVNKDVWDQTLAFAEKTVEHGGLGFWSEDGAWPGVVDEFVEWVKTERPELDPEKSGDKMETE